MYSLDILKEELTYKEQECGNFKQRYLLIDFMYSSSGREAIKRLINSGSAKIGIYGAGVLGRCLYDCIKSVDSGLTIYVFDQNQKSDYFANEMIYAPYDRLELDIMILTTPSRLFELISGRLKESGYLDVVSVDKVLFPYKSEKPCLLYQDVGKTKRLVYFYDSIYTYRECAGMRKKSLMQTEAFHSFGYDVYLISNTGKAIEIYDHKSNSYEHILFSDTVDYYETVLDLIKKINPCILYVRLTDVLKMFTMDFYKCSKEALPGMKMVLEMPTPPEFVLLNSSKEHHMEIERHYERYLHKYFEYSVNFSDIDEIFGIKSLKILNGIDADTIKIKKPIPKSEKRITLATATNMGFWNAFERVIAGIKAHYDCDYASYGYEIYFNLAGEGPELSLYKRLVKEYGLEKYINFFGVLEGSALDDFYNEADFGILALGIYRRNGDNHAGGIRLCEFCAKGIPVIYAGKLPEVCSDLPYSTEFPNDESAIDVKKIIERYEGLADGHIEELRQYALDKFDWKIYIKRLLCAIGKEI